MTDIDAHEVARRLKYKFVPKGECIRAALTENIGLHFIMAGKVVTSFPQHAYIKEMAKQEGKTVEGMGVITEETLGKIHAAEHRKSIIDPTKLNMTFLTQQ